MLKLIRYLFRYQVDAFKGWLQDVDVYRGKAPPQDTGEEEKYNTQIYVCYIATPRGNRVLASTNLKDAILNIKLEGEKQGIKAKNLLFTSKEVDAGIKAGAWILDYNKRAKQSDIILKGLSYAVLSRMRTFEKDILISTVIRDNVTKK